MTRSTYTLILVLAVAAACGRIFATQRVYEPSLPSRWPAVKPVVSPTFGSNDRSRWATVRALVDHGTYVIGTRDRAANCAAKLAALGQLDSIQAAAQELLGFTARVRSSKGILFEDGYQSVDAVLHPQKLEFYSSKPPLLSTLIAGLYWLLNGLFGWTMVDHSNAVVRTILILVNVVPFALYLKVLQGWLERWSGDPWARLFIFSAAAFGTLVSPFLITLSNHTLGTFAALFALHAVIRIWEIRNAGSLPALGWFAMAGLSAAFAVAMELPALSLAAALGTLLLWWFPARTLLLFVPSTAVIAAAMFVTNYLAVGQLRPAYSEFGGPWYEYEGSHWRRPLEGEVRRGIDWAHQQESRAAYIFHALMGHHGLFSLTPVWLLSLIGMVHGCRPRHNPPSENPRRMPWFLAPLALALTLVVVGYYLSDLVPSHNYGGFTVGLRWFMWLTPLWLVCMIPMADWLAGSRSGRGLAYALLGISVMSANYSPWNPWRHPWLYDLMVSCGWPGY